MIQRVEAHRPRKHCCALLSLVILSALVSVACAETVSESFDRGIRSNQTPYCGIYAVYGALRAYGADVRLDAVPIDTYISDPKGSTLDDLVRFTRDCGYDAIAVRNMSFRDLQQSPYPVVLWTRSELISAAPDHFVLAIPERGSRVQMLDGPRPPFLATHSVIAPYWTGVGLVVMPAGATYAGHLRASRVHVIALIGAISAAGFGLLLLARTRLHRLAPPWLAQSVTAQVGMICLMSLCVGAVVNAATTTGLLRNAEAVRAVVARYEVLSLPHVTLDEARDAVSNEGAVLIDARLAEQFEARHIPGSISIPIRSTKVFREEALKRISRADSLIVFCKNRDCGYSYDVAYDLLADGYRDVRIFGGGWDEWSTFIEK